MIPVNRHRIWQLVADGGLIALAWYLAFELRFDQGVPRYYDTLFRRTILIVVAIQLVVFVLFRFYDRWWRYVSIRDMWSAVRGVTAACVVASLTVYFFSPVAQVRLPRSVAIMDWLLLLGLICGSRLLARSVIERPGMGLVARGKEVLIAGAGDAGQLVIREMQRNRQLGYTPIGLIDDDPRKKNLRIHGVRVLGTTDELAHILRDNRPDELLIAIPSASGEARQRIVTVTRENNVPVKTLPGLYELISGESDLATQIRPVQVEDLLGRRRPRSTWRRWPPTSGASRARDRRGRLHRLGALPPDRPVRPANSSSSIDKDESALYHLARGAARARLHATTPSTPPAWRSRSKMDALFATLPARGRLPRRRLQARAPHGGAPGRGGHQQRHGHAGRRRDRGPLRRRTVRHHLHRQGGRPDQRHGGHQAGGRAGRPPPGAPAVHPHTRFASVRFGNVLGSRGQRDPALPPADRRRAARSPSPTRR